MGSEGAGVAAEDRRRRRVEAAAWTLESAAPPNAETRRPTSEAVPLRSSTSSRYPTPHVLNPSYFYAQRHVVDACPLWKEWSNSQNVHIAAARTGPLGVEEAFRFPLEAVRAAGRIGSEVTPQQGVIGCGVVVPTPNSATKDVAKQTMSPSSSLLSSSSSSAPTAISDARNSVFLCEEEIVRPADSVVDSPSSSSLMSSPNDCETTTAATAIWDVSNAEPQNVTKSDMAEGEARREIVGGGGSGGIVGTDVGRMAMTSVCGGGNNQIEAAEQGGGGGRGKIPSSRRSSSSWTSRPDSIAERIVETLMRRHQIYGVPEIHTDSSGPPPASPASDFSTVVGCRGLGWVVADHDKEVEVFCLGHRSRALGAVVDAAGFPNSSVPSSSSSSSSSGSPSSDNDESETPQVAHLSQMHSAVKHFGCLGSLLVHPSTSSLRCFGVALEIITPEPYEADPLSFGHEAVPDSLESEFVPEAIPRSSDGVEEGLEEEDEALGAFRGVGSRWIESIQEDVETRGAAQVVQDGTNAVTERIRLLGRAAWDTVTEVVAPMSFGERSYSRVVQITSRANDIIQRCMLILRTERRRGEVK